MKLQDFDQWKADAILYWSNTIYAHTNAFYDFAIVNYPSYAGPPAYENAADMVIQAANYLGNIEAAYLSYKGSSSLLESFKAYMISLYPYVTQNYTSVIPDLPWQNPQDVDANNLLNMASYDLPDYTTFFDFNTEVVTGYDGHTINNNTDLLINKLWYDGPSATTPSPTASYITDRGYMTTTASFSNTISTINAAGAADITALGNKITDITAQSNDNLVYMIYGNPKVITARKTAKQVILEDLNYQNILDQFGWQIKGINI